jgi:two-component system, NtrC family, response regulator AtoC
MTVKPRVLIVEDDSLVADSVGRVLIRQGYDAVAVSQGSEARKVLEESAVHLVILDIRLPDMNGLDFLRAMREVEPDIPVIVMTAYTDVKVAVDAMKAGATDYLQKPFELDELKVIVSRALENSRLKVQLSTLKRERQKEAHEIIGSSPQISAVRELISIVAKTPRTPVLVTGESGTGKELVANAIHRVSDRADWPLIKINVSAIPEHLLESEFFGYKKGAFTDAKENKKGLFELAAAGTLFLDEIAEMKLSLQPKLLRFLETQTFNPVGGVKEIAVDVRVIAATNNDLNRMVTEGKFRDDLYYRLKVMVIEVPALRERKQDIGLLIELFIKKANEELRKSVRSISPAAMDILMEYDWPGNVRELKNMIERAVILTQTDTVEVSALPMELVRGRADLGLRQIKTMADMERDYIVRVLSSVAGNRSEAARLLGISRSTLIEKIKRYRIEGSV